MRFFIKWTGLVTAILVALGACGSGGRDFSEMLPLAANRPTFVFFYSDN